MTSFCVWIVIVCHLHFSKCDHDFYLLKSKICLKKNDEVNYSSYLRMVKMIEKRFRVRKGERKFGKLSTYTITIQT